MTDKKISELTAIDAVTGVDLLAIVDDPAGTPATKKATAAQVKDYIIGLANTWSQNQTFSGGVNKVTITAPATGSTLTIADGKTLTANNTLTLAGTDSTTMTFPSTSGTVATLNTAQTFTQPQTISDSTSRTTSSPVLDLAQTWNASGTTFTGLKLNVTNSASSPGAPSALLQMQVGGQDRFYFRHTGLAIADAPAIGGGWGTATAGIWGPTLTSNQFNGGTGVNFRAADAIIWANGTNSFANTADLFLTRRGAANLRLGAADTTGTTAPTPQFLSAQSWASSTNNNQTGANFTIDGSQGTGTGAGGSIIFRVAPAGPTSNGVQNALSEALRINSAGLVSFAGTTSSFPALKRSSASLIVRLADDTANAALESASLKTDAPAGGTAATWKLGTVATVSPTSPNRTIEVDIGGTIYYISAKTTND